MVFCNLHNLEYVADLALEMLNEKDMLAYARGEENQTGLHVLAPTVGCGCQLVRIARTTS